MARRRVEGVGFDQHTDRYWDIYFLVCWRRMTPFDIYLGRVLKFGRLIGCILVGMVHKLWMVHVPVIMMVLFLSILISNLVNMSMQSSSHSWMIETRDPVFNSSRMKSCCDFLIVP